MNIDIQTNSKAKKQIHKAGEWHRILLNTEDNKLLTELAGQFELKRSETIRRLVRAGLNVGPALSSENSEIVKELSGQIRAVGRNLAQILRAINAGQSVDIVDLKPVILLLHERVSEVDRELTEMTLQYSQNLRQSISGDLERIDAS